jgi:ubiquinone/menaquinone biosynthesis C-methylase UbiE
MTNITQPLICVACSHTEHIFLLEVRPKYQMLRCKNCGLIFVLPQWTIPTAANVFTHYDGWPEGISGGASNRTTSLKSIAQIINHRNPEGGRILDIGCADGAFFQRMHELSSKWEMFGAEPDPKWQNHNYPHSTVKSAILQACQFPDNYFDVVTILDAFCYVPEPDKELLEIQRILKPNGYLLLDVPGQSYLKLRGLIGNLAKLQNTQTFTAYPFYYSDKAIHLLARRVNMAVVESLPHSGTIQRSKLLHFLTLSYLWFVTRASNLSNQSVSLFPKIIYIIQNQNN